MWAAVRRWYGLFKPPRVGRGDCRFGWTVTLRNVRPARQALAGRHGQALTDTSRNRSRALVIDRGEQGRDAHSRDAVREQVVGEVASWFAGAALGSRRPVAISSTESRTRVSALYAIVEKMPYTSWATEQVADAGCSIATPFGRPVEPDV
jgi:hypothetical protein